MENSSYGAINVVEVGAAHFVGMVHDFEAKYDMTWDEFFRKYSVGQLDHENDDYAAWAFLCKTYFAELSGYGQGDPPGLDDSFGLDNEPPRGAHLVFRHNTTRESPMLFRPD